MASPSPPSFSRADSPSMISRGGLRSRLGPPSESSMQGDVAAVVDDAVLTSNIANGEDMGLIIRSAFAAGRPEALLQQLRTFVRKKEVEIEELCKLHYEEFIHAVDELRFVLVDAEELKHGLNMQNNEMQEVGSVLLRKLEELIDTHGIKTNLREAIEKLRICKTVLDLCAKVTEALSLDAHYQALRLADSLEREVLPRVPARALRQFVARRLPMCRRHVERRATLELQEWLLAVRGAARDVGQQAIAHASAARRRQAELAERQRQAEEQTRSGQRPAAYALEGAGEGEEEGEGAAPQVDVAAVCRAHHLHAGLGPALAAQFRRYYGENRRLQLNADLTFQVGQFVPQAFSQYCFQVAGFFIVEDRVMRAAGGLVTPAQVEALWEAAVTRVTGVLEEQFARMGTAEHMLLVKDDASLLCAALRRYGFQVAPLLEVLDLMRDKYHDLLLADSRRQINDTLANDKYEQMVMRKEYEYSMNVLAFHIQSTDIMPAFPYVAPFSASIPECCRIVRSFIDASVSYLQHSGHMEQYDAVKKYLDRLLTAVLNEAMLRIINTPTLQVSHAIQIAANMTVLERACDFFAEHAAKLSGIPARLVEGAQGGLASRSALRNSQQVAYDVMLRLVKSKIDEMMSPADQIQWMPTEPPQGNNYVEDVHLFLETILETAKQLLPVHAFEKLSSGMLRHISARLVGALCGDAVKRFNLCALQGLATDLQVLENFADEQYERAGLKEVPGAPPLKSHLAEIRQLVYLLLSNQPEHYLSKSIREKSYFALKPEKVIIVCDKYKDPGESASLFGGANRNPKQLNKKKALEALARKLREDLASSGGGG